MGTSVWSARRGEGPTLLWITGFGISSAVLEPVADAWAHRVSSIVYDPPGIGRSGLAPVPLTLAGHADAAVDVLDGWGVDRAVVAGVSWGGLVAQRLALDHPDRLRGLVLAGSPARGAGAPLPSPAHAVAGGQLVAGLLSGWTLGLPEAAAPVLFSAGFRRDHPGRVQAALDRLAAPRPHPAALASQWVSTVREQLAVPSRPARIAVPTTVLRGEHDVLVPLAHARFLAGSVPTARHHELAGCGHLFLVERPDLALAALDHAPED